MQDFEPSRQQKVDKYEELVDRLKDELQKASDERARARVDAWAPSPRGHMSPFSFSCMRR